jgi:3-oxoacyl-[acyl-carrier-protein] synthase-3
MRAGIKAIEFVLPDGILTNEQLASEYEGWSAEKIFAKTGIVERHIARTDQCSSDLAMAASQKLFSTGICTRGEIDFVLLCTQSPDYFLPTTACLLQDRLQLPTDCGALDFNLGCSGFVYGLSLAKGLVETSQAQNVLLLTAETYSKFIHPGDKSVRTLFGDAAAATLVSAVNTPTQLMNSFVFGTDGAGARNLIVPTGGLRERSASSDGITEDESGNRRTMNNLFMNGPEIFNFTLRVVPEAVAKILERSGRTAESVDLFVFHQANRFMLEHLRKKLKVPSEKFCISMASCGNTVSSTIPIALKTAQVSGQLKLGMTVMILGFGVGYSWAGAILEWK